jgi:hypothetical protein
MNSVLEYLASLYPILEGDYRTSDGKRAICTPIALNLARRLLAENQNPFITKFQGELVDDICRNLLTPKRYQEKAEKFAFGSHNVCCAGEHAYDPMVSIAPVLILDYGKLAFVEHGVTMEIIKSQDQIKKMFKLNQIREDFNIAADVYW